MSLEGLRAWIGEVERKLGKRTRVFLALSVIAIGIAGASVYLAIDARNSSVSESDVQELQRELEAQIDEAAAGSPPAAAEEPAEPAPPEPQSGSDSAPESKPKSGGGQGDETGGAGTGASSGSAGNEAPSTGDTKIQELLERAQEQNAEAEAEQDGK